MSSNKRAQIGETMTWVVATIIIIVILTFSIFIVSSTNFDILKKELKSDKKTDLLATKDISSFLLEDSNLELIKNSVETKNYNTFEEKFIPFLKNLQSSDCPNGWFLELFVDNKKDYESPIPVDMDFDYLAQFSYYKTGFEFLSNSKKIKLNFWGLCR